MLLVAIITIPTLYKTIKNRRHRRNLSKTKTKLNISIRYFGYQHKKLKRSNKNSSAGAFKAFLVFKAITMNIFCQLKVQKA